MNVGKAPLLSLALLVFAVLFADAGAGAQGAPDIVWMKGGHTGFVSSVLHTADSQRVVTAGIEGSVMIRNAGDLSVTRTIRMFNYSMNGMAISADANVILGSGGDYYGGPITYAVKVWRKTTNTVDTLYTNSSAISDVGAVSPDGSRIAASGSLLLRTSDLSFVASEDWGPAVFTPDSQTLIVGTMLNSDFLLRFYHASDGTLFRTLTFHSPQFNSIAAVSPAGDTLACFDRGGSRGVCVVRATDGAILDSIQLQAAGSQVRVVSARYSPDGLSLVIGASAGSGETGVVEVWQLTGGAATFQKSAHTSAVGSLPWVISAAPDLGTAVFGSSKNNGSVFAAFLDRVDLTTGVESPCDAHGNRVYSVAVSPDASIVASGSADGTIKLWDRASGALIRTMNLGRVSGGLAFSPDGTKLASCSGSLAGDGAPSGAIYIWRVSDGALINTLGSESSIGANNYAYAVAFSPIDGNTVAVAYGYPMYGVRLWDVAAAIVKLNLDTQDNYYGVAFSPDGKAVAAAGLSPINVWNASSGQSLYSFQGPIGRYGAIAYSPDGKTLALGDGGFAGNNQGTNNVYLIDPTAGTVLHTYAGHTNEINTLAFPPCGDTLVSGSADGTLNFWKVSAGILRHSYDEETGGFCGGGSGTLATAFTVDGQFVAYGRNDGTVVVAKNPFWSPPVLTGVTVSPATIVGGKSATGTVTLDCPAPIGGAIISLASLDTSIATVPASVTIPLGKKSATFTVSTASVASSTSVTIRATYRGVTRSKAITVTAPALSGITVNPTSVIGGTNATGTVTLTGAVAAGTGGITVNLASANEGAARPVDGAGNQITSVTVPEGSASVSFAVATGPVGANTTVTLSASYLSVSKSATITVKAPVVSSLTLAPTSVRGGVGTSLGTVTLTGIAPAGGVSVSLASGNTAVARPVDGAGNPITNILVPEGTRTAKFAIATTAVTANTTVTLSATAGTTKSARLTVTP